MSSMREKFPDLHGLMACYFHQDWDLDDPDAEAVLHHFIKDASPAQIQRVVRDVERFLTLRLTDEQCRQALDKLWCNYNPAADGMSCTDWLRWVQNKLQDQNRGSQPWT